MAGIAGAADRRAELAALQGVSRSHFSYTWAMACWRSFDVGYAESRNSPVSQGAIQPTSSLNFERITQAMWFVAAGVRFIATNPDVLGPGEGGMVPATGAVAALISAATGVQPYYIGKPNRLTSTNPRRYTALPQIDYRPLVA
jgi:hypothetical protein